MAPSRPPRSRSDDEDRRLSLRLQVALVFCSLTVIFAMVAWRQTGWSVFAVTAVTALATAVVLLRYL